MNDPRVLENLEHGRDAGRGNLLGVQPCVTVRDYASASALWARLDGYLQAAAQRGWLNARTVVVLPEYLGTWLAVAGEGERVQQAGSLNDAMRALALRHPTRFLAALPRTRESGRLEAALFRMQAERMAIAYQTIFGRLAREHRVTVVAGSILLPAPSVEAGVVRVGQGPVQNITAVFGPDGQAHGALARKLFPTQAELPFAAGAPIETLPAFDTPAGRLGVLVCADSWHPVAYARLKSLHVDFVAVPSAILDGELWHAPWKGYDGAAAPADVDPADIGTITEGQATHKYALAGRIRAAGTGTGLNVFLRGRLWENATGGYSLAVAEGRLALEAKGEAAAMLNLWIE